MLQNLEKILRADLEEIFKVKKFIEQRTPHTDTQKDTQTHRQTKDNMSFHLFGPNEKF